MKLKILAGILLMLLGGCDPGGLIPEDEFFLSRTWKISEVLVNGEPEVDTDFSLYRLALKEDGSFTRITILGNLEEGPWSLTNAGTQLILFEGDFREERYLIIKLQLRLLELQLTQKNNKTGDKEFRFILIPVKP